MMRRRISLAKLSKPPALSERPVCLKESVKRVLRMGVVVFG